jgi:hypothetical protein
MPRVPGTFKTPPPARLVRLRSDLAVALERAMEQAGAQRAAIYDFGECRVIVGREPLTPGSGIYRWHLSISHESRYPTWDEVKAARYLAEELREVPLMAQLLPQVEDEREWVNVHDNTFHLHEIEEVK